MATPYTAVVTLRTEDATAPLSDVLRQAMEDDPDAPAASVAPPRENDAALVVTLTVDADDASLAQQVARERVEDALQRVGISTDDIDLRDVEVRTSS